MFLEDITVKLQMNKDELQVCARAILYRISGSVDEHYKHQPVSHFHTACRDRIYVARKLCGILGDGEEFEVFLKDMEAKIEAEQSEGQGE